MSKYPSDNEILRNRIKTSTEETLSSQEEEILPENVSETKIA